MTSRNDHVLRSEVKDERTGIRWFRTANWRREQGSNLRLSALRSDRAASAPSRLVDAARTAYRPNSTPTYPRA